jgi:hypothetical protein
MRPAESLQAERLGRGVVANSDRNPDWQAGMLKFSESFNGKPKASVVSPHSRLRLAVKLIADGRAQSDSAYAECAVG